MIVFMVLLPHTSHRIFQHLLGTYSCNSSSTLSF